VFKKHSFLEPGEDVAGTVPSEVAVARRPTATV